MDKLQIVNNQLTTPPANSVSLTTKEMSIGKEIYQLNQLTPYPLTSAQIEDWSMSINQLMPDVDLNDLKTLINLMKTGEVEYNHKTGIQNIFIGLRNLNKSNGNYELGITGN